MVLVKNIQGTSTHTCACGSWLQHWANFSGKPVPKQCVASGCSKPASVGGHVQLVGATDRHWFIIPICTDHNAQADSYHIRGTTIVVPANVSETCGG